MIEQATQEDLSSIIEIIKEAKKEMETENNPQWSEEDYPESKIPGDIQNKSLYLYKEENNIKGFIVITKDTGEYEGLIENSKDASYILHRMCIPKKYRHLGIASKLINFAEKKAKENSIGFIKADTEVSNKKMNNLFLKLGFIHKGYFIPEDYPGKYNYYEKMIGCE